MLEWSAANQYNSFNSVAKGMSYYGNYQNILAWMVGKEPLGPPVEVNLDIFAECNLNCYFCISQRYLVNHRDEIGSMRQLPTEYMLRLVDFLADWGVKGLCISGGGEPTLHKGLPELIRAAAEKMDVCVVTNAVEHYSDELIEALVKCRWVALSIDAARPHTYKVIKGKERFRDVIRNVAKLSRARRQAGAGVDLCYKYLLLPENQAEIVAACKLAKRLGVQDFHLRPVDFERADLKGAQRLRFNKVLVQQQFEACHALETEGFRVCTVQHKFNEDFHVQHNFAECLATPLVLPVLQDGNGYLCVDKKIEAGFRLGSAYPDPEKILDWWGGRDHRQLVNSVDVDECSRCTWSSYQQQIVAVENDSMCRAFP